MAKKKDPRGIVGQRTNLRKEIGKKKKKTTRTGEFKRKS